MKKLFMSIILVVLLVIPIAVFAASDVTFEWDANTEADLAGYRLYQSSVSVSTLDTNNDGIITLSEFQNGPSFGVGYAPVGTETVTIQVEDGTWYWVLTAYDTGDNESDPSIEVTATLDTEAPAPPQNLFIKLIQKIVALIRSIFAGLFDGFRAVA